MTKRTPLYEEHLKLKAKMSPFAEFEMPIQYSGVIDEHQTVRNKAGLFDVSHMGEFEIKGEDAQNFLNYLTANDVRKLTDGKAQYSLLCNEQGGIVDDILVYRFTQEHFVMVVNAANIQKDFEWVTKHKNDFPKMKIENISEEVALLAFQGPQAIAILKPLTDISLKQLKTFHFALGTIAGEEKVVAARTGYTGEDGIEIFCRSSQASPIWRAILETGAPLGAKPVGLGARDTLRLEARLSLYGHEINDATNPIEAGLSWVVKLDKPSFIGKEAIQKVKQEGLKKQIVGFKMNDRAIPRQGFKIFADNQEIGFVTSGTFSPTLQIGIGLGYVPVNQSAIGTKFYIDIRGNLKLAEVVATPFYKRSA